MSRSAHTQAARDERERCIVAAARRIAEAEGWPAVTVRRLADAIGYSQPVLYGHFPDGRQGILRGVVLDGMRQLATELAAAEPGVRGVAERYLAFARDNVAVYDAMFAMPVDLDFGTADTLQPLRDAFAPIERAVAGPGDAETRAEVLWSTLHGLAQLARHQRLRPSHLQQRLDFLADILG